MVCPCVSDSDDMDQVRIDLLEMNGQSNQIMAANSSGTSSGEAPWHKQHKATRNLMIGVSRTGIAFVSTGESISLCTTQFRTVILEGMFSSLIFEGEVCVEGSAEF